MASYYPVISVTVKASNYVVAEPCHDWPRELNLDVPHPHREGTWSNCWESANAWSTVMNNIIHHVLILPSVGHFKDKSLTFAFDSQNELVFTSGNMIVWFPDSAQLTRLTHACGK
ncbi:hypothetical protein DSO57_1007357 [Entomophthora muscae]|uniref:Uncharacterized protein n=1 Tax=Entomophthora muscae TaxID=34485 RepID=A0ACC2S9I3_9FUNG|nr:hypothetical protein DSO57_1007357 [Entomophthora muscae]